MSDSSHPVGTGAAIVVGGRNATVLSVDTHNGQPLVVYADAAGNEGCALADDVTVADAMPDPFTIDSGCLTFSTPYFRMIPLGRIEAVSITKAPDWVERSGADCWHVGAEVAEGDPVTFARFDLDAAPVAARCAARWAGQVYGVGPEAGTAHAEPLSDSEFGRVQGNCLQHVTAQGTRFLPLHGVQELLVTRAQQTPEQRARGWYLAARVAGGGELCLQPFGDDRDAAVAAAPAWAAQIFLAPSLGAPQAGPRRAEAGRRGARADDPLLG